MAFFCGWWQKGEKYLLNVHACADGEGQQTWTLKSLYKENRQQLTSECNALDFLS